RGAADRLGRGATRRVDPRHPRRDPGARRGRAGRVRAAGPGRPPVDGVLRMSADDLTLADVDRDGALAEAFADVHGQTRGAFLRAAALAAASLLAALALPGRADAASRDT